METKIDERKDVCTECQGQGEESERRFLCRVYDRTQKRWQVLCSWCLEGAGGERDAVNNAS